MSWEQKQQINLKEKNLSLRIFERPVSEAGEVAPAERVMVGLFLREHMIIFAMSHSADMAAIVLGSGLGRLALDVRDIGLDLHDAIDKPA